MLDTIKLFTDDFAISDDASIEIRPADIDYRTGEQKNSKLFLRSNGQWVQGSKAFLNADNYNVTIKPNNLTGDAWLWVSLSVPKFITGDNFYALNDDQENDLPNVLEKELAKNGIGFDAKGLRVSRVDAFQNVYASESFSDYVPVFQLLRAKRQNRRDYGSTFLWENTQRQLCVYDKVTEVENRGLSVTGLPKNTIRFEYRLLRSKSVMSALGIKTAVKLFENLGSVREMYREAMKHHLFDLDTSEVKRLISSELRTVVKHYFDTGSRFWFTNMLKDYGGYSIARLSDLSEFENIVQEIAGNRFTAYRAVKQVRESRNNVSMLEVLDCGKTIEQLYQELKQKVLEVS